MGQLPRPLKPSRSVLDYVGAQVREFRVARGQSQAELGTQVFAHRDLVRRVETAERVPSREFIERCDTVFDAGGALIRLLPLIERERLLRATHDSEARALSFRSAALDRPVLDWLLAADEADHDDVADDTAADAAAHLEQLRALDHAQGAGAAYPTVAGLVDSRLAILVEAAPRVAVGMLELAGYDAVDLGVDGLAQQHYLDALAVVTQTGDRLYGGYLVAVSLAHLALHCGDADQALRLATAGLRETERRATPATRAAFRTVLARAHARRGDETACTAALLGVEADLQRSRPGDEPAWIAYFGAADLADEKAHCFFDLGRYDLAYRETENALELLPPDRVRRIGIDTALQAAVLARNGQIEHACAVARRAIDLADGVASFRIAHRIVLMLAELQSQPTCAEVREITEYAQATLQPVNALT